MTSHNPRYISPALKKPYRGILQAVIYVQSEKAPINKRPCCTHIHSRWHSYNIDLWPLTPLWSVTAVIWTMDALHPAQANSIVFTLHDTISCTVHPITCRTRAQKCRAICSPHDSDFSEQTTISADSKIINSGRAAADREPPTRGRYITRSRGGSMPRRFYLLLPPFGQRRRGRSTARFRGANEPGEKNGSCELPQGKSNKVRAGNVDGGKIKSKARMDRGAKIEDVRCE